MENYVVFESKLGSYAEQANELGVLTKDFLFWQHEGIKQQLDLNDVVGTSLINRGANNQPALLISTYPKRKAGLLTKKTRRILQEYYFTCSDLVMRSQWQLAINNTLLEQPVDAVVKRRHLQIIINPTSGKKKAVQIFEAVRPLFDRSNLTYVVSRTKSPADTKNLVHNLNLLDIDGLVIVGGDGTIHDAIAGLMSRSDWEQAIKLPLGIIPGGTGNGLCKSLLELSGESYDPLNAAFLIIKGKQQSFDLATVKQNNLKYYSFLSLSWGLISDVDIESEKLKILGALRFDIYALLLLGSLRTYRGRFSFIPHLDCKITSEQTIADRGEWKVIEDEFIFIWGMNTAWAAHDMNVTPHAQINDGAMDVLVMRKGASRLEILQALLRCGKGEHLDLPHIEYYKVTAFRLEPLTDKGILVVDGEPVEYLPIEMEIIPRLACVNC
jgi:sphingosine kinase